MVRRDLNDRNQENQRQGSASNPADPRRDRPNPDPKNRERDDKDFVRTGKPGKSQDDREIERDENRQRQQGQSNLLSGSGTRGPSQENRENQGFRELNR